MDSSTDRPLCPACRQGQLHTVTRQEVFHPRGTEVCVALLTSLCDACGVQTTRASQHEENLRRLVARKQHYGKVLMGEEIVALRKRYGLTQQAAAQIFGKGKVAFSRYENEVSYPDDSTTLLLQLALEKPDSLKWLADRAGVDLPQWRERSEEDPLPPHPPDTAMPAAASKAGSRHPQRKPALRPVGQAPNRREKQPQHHPTDPAQVADGLTPGLMT